MPTTALNASPVGAKNYSERGTEKIMPVAEMTFGEKLKVLRAEAKLTQEKLAVKAGVTVSVVRKLEQTGSDPSWDTARAIARALGVSLDKLAAD
jgi:DNA-binding XRE family transcriptional regulator